MNTFPNLDGATDFPDVSNIRVYQQYKNGFDYTRWVADTQILLCSVPWDGNNNVVCFGDDDTRDAWFADLEGYRDTLQTEMRILPDGMIKVPVPFDASGLYNYVWVAFPIATSETQPLDHEPTSAVRHWGFFIDDMKYRSPSCTELMLTVDWWTTFINGIDVRSMMLARGHYAMQQAASVADYLDEPLTHTAWLQGVEPESVGEPITNVKASIIVNDSDPYLVFDVGAASAGGDFADGVPYAAAHYATNKGFPSGQMFAVPLGSADTFATSAPVGLWQCVRAAYVVPSKFLNIGSSFTIGGVTVYDVTGGASVTQDVKLTADDFGYAEDYAGITKLYTNPYATVHLVSDTGQDVTIAPETLGSTQRVEMTSQVTAAGVRVLSVLQGVGSSTISNLTLRNLTARNFAQSGAWQKTVMQWDLPCFAVYQSSDELNDYLHQWSRTQARSNAYVAYQNALAANATAYDNTNANATLTTTTAANSASNITSNNATTVAANTANTNANIAQSTSGASASINKLVRDVTSDLNASYAALQAEQAVVGVAMSNNDARSQAASVSQDMSLISGIANVAGAAATGNVVGAVSGAVSTLAGQVSASTNIATDWQTANASALVTASNNTALYNAGVANATEKGAHARTYTSDATSIANTAKSTINANNNNAQTTIAANNAKLTNANAASQAATARANATRSKATTDANAQRAYDNALAAVTNGIYTDNAQAPKQFGAVANMDARQIVPMGVQVKIERGCDDDIARCGDSMLRYGYCCDRNVSSFPGWQVMKHFTYWQSREIWMCANGKAPESAMRFVRALVESGMTVWSKPDEIGAVSIYDN